MKIPYQWDNSACCMWNIAVHFADQYLKIIVMLTLYSSIKFVAVNLFICLSWQRMFYMTKTTSSFDCCQWYEIANLHLLCQCASKAVGLIFSCCSGNVSRQTPKKVKFLIRSYWKPKMLFSSARWLYSFITCPLPSVSCYHVPLSCLLPMMNNTLFFEWDRDMHAWACCKCKETGLGMKKCRDALTESAKRRETWLLWTKGFLCYMSQNQMRHSYLYCTSAVAVASLSTMDYNSS